MKQGSNQVEMSDEGMMIRAKYTRSRRAILDQVNLDLEILRFQVRLAKDQIGQTARRPRQALFSWVLGR